MATRSVTGAEEVRLGLTELLGAERRLRARDKKCGPGDLTTSQVRALFKIEIEGETTAGDIAKAAELSPASVTAMLDHLERDGVIERRRAEHDRRVVTVTLTERGRELVAAKRDAWRARAAQALEGLGEAELRAAADVMRRMAAMLDELQPQGGAPTA
jgi:DNA-binding MarR family transcriptional regulator